MEQIVAYCSDLQVAKSALSQQTPQGLHGAINGMFNHIKKELLAYAEAASAHRRDDGSREQWILENSIARSKECIADACLAYANGLREIAMTEPQQSLDQKERMLKQAIATYEEGLAQLEVAMPGKLALSVQRWALTSKDKVKDEIAFNRTAIAKSMNSAGFDLRILNLEASDAQPQEEWVKKYHFASRAAECMEAMVVRQQRAPYLDDVYREMCRDDLALLVADHAYAAETHRTAARWQRDKFSEGRPIDAPTMTASLRLAQHHAARTKHWASLRLEKLKEQSQRRVTSIQSAEAAKQRNEVIAVRGNASEILIESAAITSWSRRKQVTRHMDAHDYGGDSAIKERLRDWLTAFDERSAALEGALLTQLTPMLSKQRVEGHHDLSSHALLHSAVQNLRVLEQEAIAMAASAEEHGVGEGVLVCKELAKQKNQICESLGDDLKRLQDYADLVGETAAPKPKKRRKASAAKGAGGGGPEDAAAAAAPVLFDTIMEGTLAGRMDGGLMLVENDLTRQVVAYRHGEEGLWQRVAVDGDAETPPRPAAAPAAAAPAKLAGAAKIAAKAQQYSEDVAAHLRRMDGEESFALAQYHHRRATVAQSEALDYLDRLRSDLLEAGSDPGALAAAGTQRQRVADAGRGMGQRLLAWTARQPRYDGGSLAYLLQHAPNVRVDKTVTRKLLAQAKVTRVNVQPDYMDEYRIDAGYGHPPSEVHVHYGKSKAELYDFTACHLKYGTDEAPVRNNVSRELLKEIAAKSLSAGPPARRAYRNRRAGTG